uniref:Proteasome subunit beta n=1 Tax=Bos mutus grunniens TaxID=30521 RepID=A0A8B9YRN8_BOSMU
MEPHSSVGPLQLRFSPYAFNGGTVLAIAGEDFSIVASDTRLSEGFSIHTRDSPKCYKLTDKTVIGCSGFHGDCLTLTKIIEARLKMYKHSNNKAMTTGAVAAMLSTILYSRRFFPYYVYNIIGGLDEEAPPTARVADIPWPRGSVPAAGALPAGRDAPSDNGLKSGERPPWSHLPGARGTETRRHPALRAQIKVKPEPGVFVLPPPIKASVVMVTGTLRQLEQMVSEQQATYAPQARPRHRWRLGGRPSVTGRFLLCSPSRD